MALLISDANIFIDFNVCGLLGALFKLSQAIGVPDMLFEDELREHHANLIDLGLQLLTLQPTAMRRTAEFATKYQRTSRLDLAALALAEQEGCHLLTGDRYLREAAEKEGVTVHGTLWLGEQLVVQGVIDFNALVNGYAIMKASGRRLPWAQMDRQLARLQTAHGSIK